MRIHKIGLDREILKGVLGVGVSAMLMQVMQMVQQTIMYNLAEQCGGGEWQTILGGAMSLQAFAFIPLWGISHGFQPAVGTNYDIKKYSCVKRITFTFIVSADVLRSDNVRA